MITHSSILTREIPWTEAPGGLQSMGSQKVGQDLATKQQQHWDKLQLVSIPLGSAWILSLRSARSLGWVPLNTSHEANHRAGGFWQVLLKVAFCRAPYQLKPQIFPHGTKANEVIMTLTLVLKRMRRSEMACLLREDFEELEQPIASLGCCCVCSVYTGRGWKGRPSRKKGVAWTQMERHG